MPYTRGVALGTVGLFCAIILAASVYPAHADSTWTLPPFSKESSDGTDPGLLNATWTFGYDHSAQTFDITVQNQTVNPPAAFTISELFFNITIPEIDSVQFHSYTYPTAPVNFGPTLTDANDGGGQPTKADGFGVFDFWLDLGKGNAGTAAGDTATFHFEILDGKGPNVGAQALFGELTDGMLWRYAAIKWTQGVADDASVLEEDDDSAYSTPTPEPCTLGLLLCTASAFFAVARRRRRAA